VGGQAQLIGQNLHCDPGDPLQDVFFVAADETATRYATVFKRLAE
jgi:hypothetical protein